MKLNYTLPLALLVASHFPALASNNNIAYLTSWGQPNQMQTALQDSKLDTFMLSFGNWDENGEITVSDGLIQQDYDPYWLPAAYQTWTDLKHQYPEKSMLVAFGGQADEQIWDYIQTPEQREQVANHLLQLFERQVPVYKKNLSPEQVVGECLNYNWDGSRCDYGTYQTAGYVHIDGFDFDFEKVARITEGENQNLLALVRLLREKSMHWTRQPILTLTTYHVGADPVSCDNSEVIESCSYIEPARSAHNGEVISLLQQSKDVFDVFNVMAYDAGPNFRYKVAMQNYANAIGGDKSKLRLGLTNNSQWGPDSNFVQSEQENINRVAWAHQQGYGGFFIWTLGASTEQMSAAEQVRYTNALVAARQGEVVEQPSGQDEGSEQTPTPTPPTPTPEPEQIAEPEELLLNGSFEDYTATEDQGKRKYAELTGWQGNSEVWTQGLGKDAIDGSHKIELDIGREVDQISQSIETQANRVYEFSIYAYARRLGASDFEVYLDDQQILRVTPDQIWRKYSVNFVGAGGSQTLSIKERSSQNTGSGAVLDLAKVITLNDQAASVSIPGMTHKIVYKNNRALTWYYLDKAQLLAMLDDHRLITFLSNMDTDAERLIIK